VLVDGVIDETQSTAAAAAAAAIGYELSSVIFHIGRPSYGHYVCAAKTGSDDWTLYNDNEIDPLVWSDIEALGFGDVDGHRQRPEFASQCSAYILLYTKK
jgi:ubiquitin C-terminal hydrolase